MTQVKTSPKLQVQAQPKGRHPMVYRESFSKLHATSLTPEWHKRTCGYWFIVQNGAMSHTAFATRAGLDRWMAERGLALESELPEAGTFGTTRIVGEYRTASHGEIVSDDPNVSMGPGEFDSLRPVLATATLSNGEYTLALITEEDGVRVVNTLNVNVRSRVVFDRKHTAEWLAR